MSRLHSMIRRLEAQRDCLDQACRLIENVPGTVLEIGLGNGRTYDHLRERLPGRRIIALDRALCAHPECRPAPHDLVLGEIAETLPRLAAELTGRIALAHSDLGDGTAAYGQAMAAMIAAALDGRLAPDAILLSDYPAARPGFEPVSLPAGVLPGRYCIYRYRSGAGR